MNGHFQFDTVDVKSNDDWPEEGVFTDLPAEAYHDLDGRASSSIVRKIYNKTPAHAKAQIDDESEPTSAMRFGTQMHMAVLEPERFAERHAVSTQCQAVKGSGDQCGSAGKVPYRRDDGAVVWFCGRSSHQPDLAEDADDYPCPYCDVDEGETCVTASGNETSPHAARKKAARTHETVDGDVVIEEKADVEVLSEDRAEQIENMRSRLESHPSARQLLFELGGLNEVSIVFDYQDDGDLSVPAKARIDRIVKHPTFGVIGVDYKTTRNAKPGPHEFGRSIDRRRYDMQGEFYVHAARTMDIPVRAFAIVAQEKEPPYAVSVHVLPMEGYEYIDDNTVADLQNAEEDVKAALRQYLQCAHTGIWPAYADSPVIAEVPAWADAGTRRDDR